MENLVKQRLFAGGYEGTSVFVTGHTGFKGSWLCEWLLAMGASVTGYSDKVDDGPTMFRALGLEKRITHIIGDVRDPDMLVSAIDAARPDYVFHLAAQPLVRLSYDEPVTTFETNVMGTVNVMEALRRLNQSVACVLVTSDKCYENREVLSGYREDDPLGGYDPYSASKGAAEIAIHAYRRSFFMSGDSRVRVASGRAGNVIGGGDWSADRIVPDSARSLMANQPIHVRNPFATRPWQHVLESLSGYLWLGALLAGQCQTARVTTPVDASEGFNFGPLPNANRTVEALIEEFLTHWPGTWTHTNDGSAHHEAALLGLSVERAYHKLDWSPVLDFEKAVALTASWYRDTFNNTIAPRSKTLADLAFYVNAAASQEVAWAS
ncbi:CDP-glucose 4,6-dehydratase [Ruegeria atlantica]|uniref:CDP-glucose 4,6-dehydratase n=1 Tax=Ruegeria atlantica TaxID=81569 RepID=UPI002493DC85|nr:CDP-glucose 4,6-dehydratase [Ruegeria atlantica]